MEQVSGKWQIWRSKMTVLKLLSHKQRKSSQKKIEMQMGSPSVLPTDIMTIIDDTWSQLFACV